MSSGRSPERVTPSARASSAARCWLLSRNSRVCGASISAGAAVSIIVMNVRSSSAAPPAASSDQREVSSSASARGSWSRYLENHAVVYHVTMSMPRSVAGNTIGASLNSKCVPPRITIEPASKPSCE